MGANHDDCPASMDQPLKVSTFLRGFLFHLLILRLRVGNMAMAATVFQRPSMKVRCKHINQAARLHIYSPWEPINLKHITCFNSSFGHCSFCAHIVYPKKLSASYFLGIQIFQKNCSGLYSENSLLFIYMDMQANLEITVISAVNLENVRKFGRRLRAYAVVGADTSPTCKSTRVDTEGGSYPVWNHNLQLELGLSERTLFYRKASASVTIQVYCETSLGKKLVGWTKVPFSDIVEGYRDPHSLHFLSYRLKTSQGKPQSGIINLCVRLLPKQSNYYSQQPGFNSGPLHYSEKPGFNSAPVHYSQQQGNIQNMNYSISHQPQPQPQQMTAFSGTYHPSEFHEAGGSHVGNKNSAYCYPHAAPMVYPPPPPYSSYATSIK